MILCILETSAYDPFNFDAGPDPGSAHKKNYQNLDPELKTLEWWISGLRLNPLFFLISRLNIACSPLIINLQIN